MAICIWLAALESCLITFPPLAIAPQALPEDKKHLSAELFWLSFRLHAGLPLNPGDPHAGVDSTPGKSEDIGHLFENDDAQRHTNREMALLMLCSFAEGAFKRPKSKKTRVRGMGTIDVFGWSDAHSL